MPKGPCGERHLEDTVGLAAMVAQVAIGENEDTRLKTLVWHKSGLAGGKARTENLEDEVRSFIARKAAAGRLG